MCLALAVEFPHSRNSLRDVFDGVLCDLQVASGAFAEIRLLLKKRLGIKRDRRNRIIDIVGNSAGHLAECTQSFLLHHGLLGLAKIVVGDLQRVIQVRLMRSQRHVLA